MLHDNCCYAFRQWCSECTSLRWQLVKLLIVVSLICITLIQYRYTMSGIACMSDGHFALTSAVSEQQCHCTLAEYLRCSTCGFAIKVCAMAQDWIGTVQVSPGNSTGWIAWTATLLTVRCLVKQLMNITSSVTGKPMLGTAESVWHIKGQRL